MQRIYTLTFFNPVLRMPSFDWPPQITLREVGLRDGLQSIARVLPTEHKLEWIRGAYAAGLRELEVGSFASMGMRTGVDFEQLVALRTQLAQWLSGETLHGAAARAGLPLFLRKTSLESTP